MWLLVRRSRRYLFPARLIRILFIGITADAEVLIEKRQVVSDVALLLRGIGLGG